MVQGSGWGMTAMHFPQLNSKAHDLSIFTDEVSMGNCWIWPEFLLRWLSKCNGMVSHCWPGQVGLGTGRKQIAGPRLPLCCWSRATGAGFLVRGGQSEQRGRGGGIWPPALHHTVHHCPCVPNLDEEIETIWNHESVLWIMLISINV